MKVEIQDNKAAIATLVTTLQRGESITLMLGGIPVGNVLPPGRAHSVELRQRRLGLLADAQWHIAQDWQETPPEMFAPITTLPQ